MLIKTYSWVCLVQGFTFYKALQKALHVFIKTIPNLTVIVVLLWGWVGTFNEDAYKSSVPQA